MLGENVIIGILLVIESCIRNDQVQVFRWNICGREIVLGKPVN
jgi:hypothetical protein